MVNMPQRIIIVGAGMVGLACASALAQAGFEIIIIETKVFEPEINDIWDSQVSTLNKASINFLKNLHLWEKISSAKLAILKKMCVWDELGGGLIEFDAENFGYHALGYIVENQALIQACLSQLETFENVKFYSSCPKELIITPEKASLILENNTQLEATLVIGADGQHSWIRQHSGISVTEHLYLQTALVGIVNSEMKHHHTALQNFMPTGTLGLLPLKDLNESVFIWSADSNSAEQLLALSNDHFNRRITAGMHKKLGKMSLQSSIKSFPLRMRHSTRYVGDRIALIGDAAHNIHPLAGQGVNLGLMDAATLASVIIDASNGNKDSGELKCLRRYERARKGPNNNMIRMVEFFNNAFRSEAIPLVSARSLSLNTLNKFSTIKKYFVDYAFGDYEELPELAKYRGLH